jgi:hypothetical protein
VRADLRHQENFVAPAFQAFAHPVFRFAAVVFPAVIEKIDSRVHRLVH